MITPQEARKLVKAREARKAYKEQQKNEQEKARKEFKADVKKDISDHFSENWESIMTEIVEPKIKQAIYEDIPFFIVVPYCIDSDFINSSELADMHERIDEPPYDKDIGYAICSAFNKVKANNYHLATILPPEKQIECDAIECVEMTIEVLHDLYEDAGWNISPMQHYILRTVAGKPIPLPMEVCAEGFQIFFK